jgi:hypothetical protein
MSDPSAASVTTRPRDAIPAYLPRWGFFKGFLTGAVVEVPALAGAVWVLAQLGIGDPDVSFMRIIRLTTVFAGIASVLTAAGIGRLAAHASMLGGRRRALWVAARAHAIASAGLVLIAAIPHGHLPTQHAQWLAFPAAGLVVGALCGVLIGAVCSGVAPVGIAEVWSLAKRPSEALRHLLAPEDLFEGMFDPAPLPPGTEPKPADEPSPIVEPPPAKPE